MIIVYHSARFYLPLLACALHLGLSYEAEDFFRAGWAEETGKPLRVMGRDDGGNIVCSLIHGRHGGLYKRALEGAADVFELSCRCIRVEDLLTVRRTGRNLALSRLIACHLPHFLGPAQRRAIARALDRQLKRQREEGRP
ncbi:MAG TPA: hypothetical protein PKA10_11395 [Selenomonadales bacterium]|nr:hypothetical protein [Selenomonadales bacterium]